MIGTILRRIVFRKIFSALPKWMKSPLRRSRVMASRVLYHGDARLCPVCGKSSRRFRRYGAVPREDAQCVHCGSLERHRFLWLFLSRKTNLFDGTPGKILHVAPERCLEPRFREQLDGDYLTADLMDPRAMVKMDITDIPYPDQSFDIIYCSHVLEHVDDDRKAMREFFRVLKDDGWAILLVPITRAETYEDPSIVEPLERLKAFGQEDHVRRYGPDYVDRLHDAGFNVEITDVNDLVTNDEAVTMGLKANLGKIHFCTK